MHQPYPSIGSDQTRPSVSGRVSPEHSSILMVIKPELFYPLFCSLTLFNTAPYAGVSMVTPYARVFIVSPDSCNSVAFDLSICSAGDADDLLYLTETLVVIIPIYQ